MRQGNKPVRNELTATSCEARLLSWPEKYKVVALAEASKRAPGLRWPSRGAEISEPIANRCRGERANRP